MLDLIFKEGDKLAQDENYRKSVEIQILETWFDDYFHKQFEQSQWQKNFSVSPDKYLKDENGQPLTYETIDDLKEKGEEVKEEIKRLRNLLNDKNINENTEINDM